MLSIPGQHAEEAPHVVEYGERDEGRLGRQPRRVRVHHGVGGERQEGHHEHRAVPKKALGKKIRAFSTKPGIFEARVPIQ